MDTILEKTAGILMLLVLTRYVLGKRGLYALLFYGALAIPLFIGANFGAHAFLDPWFRSAIDFTDLTDLERNLISLYASLVAVVFTVLGVRLLTSWGPLHALAEKFSLTPRTPSVRTGQQSDAPSGEHSD